jgi:Divergent InlB B-repeat domain
MNTRRLASFVLAALLVSLVVPLCINSARADEDQYILTVTVNGTGCSAGFNGTGTYTYGDTVQLTTDAAPGWNFSGWSGDLTSSDNPLTITMDTNITINALFVQNSYTVEVDQSSNGTVSPATASYLYGSDQDFTITPNNGYYIKSITLDDQALNVTSPANQTVRLIDIQADHILTATYSPFIYNLTVYTIGQGSVTPNNGTYLYGDSVTLTAASANGWAFHNWSDNSTNSTITIVMNNNENVTATFVQNPTPSPTPAPTSTPSPIPTSTPNPIPTSTPNPKLKAAGISDYVLVAAAGVILVGIVLGLFRQRRKHQVTKLN